MSETVKQFFQPGKKWPRKNLLRGHKCELIIMGSTFSRRQFLSVTALNPFDDFPTESEASKLHISQVIDS